MDTLDNAASLADSQVADSSNRDWLLASARSSQLSTDLRRYQLECSINSSSINSCSSNYGTLVDHCHGVCINTSQPAGGYHEAGPSHQDKDDESKTNCSSWLQRHYAPKSSSMVKGNSQKHYGNNISTNCTNYTINNHIYDNISFADSPILRSLSRKTSGLCNCDAACHENHHKHNHPDHHHHHQQQQPSRKLKNLLQNSFRFFLACYLLLGITLAIYSRNALSLAAVGMTANNVMTKELTDIMSANSDYTTQFTSNNNFQSANRTTNLAFSDDDDALEGACPIVGLAPTIKTAQNLNSIPTQVSNGSSNTKLQVEFNLSQSIRQRVENGQLVDWTPGEQGLIFAAGSVGNLLIAIPLTRLGEIYGPKWIIFIASLGATIQAALMPIISPCSVILVIIFQVIFNGLTYGADCVAYTLFAHWLTPTEMAFFVSCLMICYQLGTILSSFATAKILTESLSWSWCFYTPAILCGLWTLVWALIGASEPSKSKIISKSELLHLTCNSKIACTIREDSAKRNSSANSGAQQDDDPNSISWLKLARDPNIWAICAVKFTLRWYFTVYLSLMPTYLSSVVHMSVGTIGKMSVIQSFIGLFAGILVGYLTKSLVTKRPFNLSLATTRKIFQSIVNFGLVISLIVFILYDCDQWVIIVSLTLGGICINFYVAAALQLPLDLSPNHCGLITSITNTLAFGQALGAPISGLILDARPKDRGLWRLVWLVSILLNLISGLIFILLVDSKPRDYSKDKNRQRTSNHLHSQ